MPTETFLRLPEEKRGRFVEAAWEEFLRVPFEEASINKIVMKARVPRGSFYQYFADKKTLFYYLLGDMMQYLLAEYSKVLQENGGDIFRTQIRCFDLVLREQHHDPLFLRGVALLQRNPMFLTQQIVENQVVYHIWEAVKPCVDISMFRNDDEELAKQTMVMSLVTLVMTMTDAIARPGEIEDCRRVLLMRMDVLKHGSLKPCREGESDE